MKNLKGIPIRQTQFQIREGIRHRVGERVLVVSQQVWNQLVKRPKAQGVGISREYDKISLDEFKKGKKIVDPPKKENPYTEEDYQRDYDKGKELKKEGKNQLALEHLKRASKFKTHAYLNKLITELE